MGIHLISQCVRILSQKSIKTSKTNKNHTKDIINTRKAKAKLRKTMPIQENKRKKKKK